MSAELERLQAENKRLREAGNGVLARALTQCPLEDWYAAVSDLRDALREGE